MENLFICNMAANGSPYAASGVYDPTDQRQHKVYLHHFVLPKIPGKVIDHINQNTLDNRRCNLRNVSRTINGINAKLRQSNTTGYAGLTRITTRPAWNAKWSISPGVSRNRSFLDKKYGGTEAAREAAIAFLTKKKAEVPHYVKALQH